MLVRPGLLLSRLNELAHLTGADDNESALSRRHKGSGGGDCPVHIYSVSRRPSCRTSSMQHDPSVRWLRRPGAELGVVQLAADADGFSAAEP